MTKKRQKAVPAGPYVYALTDPRTGAVFYIGKGRGRRMFRHELEAAKGSIGPRFDVIRELSASGLRPSCVVIGEFDTDAQAYAAEREAIAAHQNLTNRNAGGAGGMCETPYARMRRQAADMLARMMSLDEWLARLSVGTKAAVCAAFGSAEAAYIAIRGELTKQAADPAPNVIRWGSDGALSFGWE